MVQLGCSLKKLIFKVKVCNCDNQRMIEKTWKETKEEEGKYYLQKKLKSLANKLRAEVGKTTILLGVFKKSSSAGNARVIKRSKSKNQTSATHGKTFSLLLLKDLEELWWFISNVTWKALTSLPCLFTTESMPRKFWLQPWGLGLKWIENFLWGWSSRQKIYKWIWNDSVKPFISQAQLDELDVKMKPSAKLTINFKSYQMK